MPAVFYGPKEKSTPIAINIDEFKKVRQKAGESTVIELIGDGEKKEVLIQDIDIHPVTGEIRHVDFYVMEKGKKVSVNVPLEFIGIAPAVKELGGVLIKVMHEVEIKVLPKDLPRTIEVDTTTLIDFEGQIQAKNLTIPEGAELVTNPEEAVALVNEIVEEHEEEVPASIEDIEVAEKGKKETEEAPQEEKKEPQQEEKKEN